ncbi:Topoisomerase 1B, partial [Operophtera brumata]
MSSLCRVCLAGNRRMNCIENIELRKLFQKLSSMEATQETLSILNIAVIPNLSVSSIKHMSLDDSDCSSPAGSGAAVKQEPTADDEGTIKLEESTDVDDIETGAALLKDTKPLKLEGSSTSKIRAYACNQCDKTYNVKNSLLKHIKNHSGKTYTHTCDRCAKIFTDNSNLQKHMLIHSGERPHACARCDKAFVRKFQLHEHMRILNNLPYIAALDCVKLLEHKGPVFAPDYEPLPSNVRFFYDGKEIRLSQDTEEVAGFYARMDHDYTTKSAFNSNFFADWCKVMTRAETELIKDLSKCNFKQMAAYFASVSKKNKNLSKHEKASLKAKNKKIQKEYGFCTIDGRKEKIGNFRIEPPGLFRGRGEHPKMGMLKRRVMPEDVLINCSENSKIPIPPAGHKWKEVRHDKKVTWLASWTENVQGNSKYVMLHPSSKLKGEMDLQKYETARELHKYIDKIRDTYRSDWKAKEMRVQQRAVALYFIDRLALRAGNVKDDDQADTVGCCSLRVEHIELHKEMDGKEYVVVFDFLGKDSIRYYNEVPVEKQVFENLELFMESKKGNDDLFDLLNTQTLNEHLKDLMSELTAKCF